LLSGNSSSTSFLHTSPAAFDYPASLISSHCSRQRALSEAEDGSRVWHLVRNSREEGGGGRGEGQGKRGGGRGHSLRQRMGQEFGTWYVKAGRRGEGDGGEEE